MDTNNSITVSTCILTFNRCSLLRGLLEELTKINVVPMEIIVIDNHSQDMTREMMTSMFPYVKYIRTERNIGASARNIGMKAAKGDIIVTLDDDIRGLSDQEIEILIRAFCEDVTIGAVNFSVVNADGNICNWVHHCKQEDCYDKEFLTYEITEGAVAFRRTALERSGYYPEKFFISHEGPDLAFRIMDNDYSVVYMGSIRVTHYFASQGREPWRNYYYDTRNQLWLAARNFPITYALIYLGRGLLSMLVYSLRDGYFTYWLKAMVDGVLGLKQVIDERCVLSDSTMKMVRSIDAHRPSLGYMIKNRLLEKRAINLK